MNKKFKPKITLFHCINSFDESASLSLTGKNNFEIKIVRLPCSSMIKDVFLLRSFESGSDGVLVLVCSEDQCRYVEGSIRARKRSGGSKTYWTKSVLMAGGFRSEISRPEMERRPIKSSKKRWQYWLIWAPIQLHELQWSKFFELICLYLARVRDHQR